MKHFGPTKGVKATHSAGAYEIRGGLGMWLAARFPACRYRFATAEFGTYSPLRVIRALLEELRWHTRLGGKAGEHWSRRQLTETFVPRSRAWRHKCVERGISLVASALKVSERAAEAQL
jgi:hypothetical protein